MRYEVLLERVTERDLRRLSAQNFARVIARLHDLEHDARPPGCRKISGSKNDWRIRVGNHRILYEIEEKAKQGRV